MSRKKQDRRRSRRNYQDRPRSSVFTSAFRKPGTQILVLLVVALLIFLILQFGRGNTGGTNSLPDTIDVGQAYSMYQNGAFVLDVRTVEEWNEYHVPDTTLIPLDQLASRLNEVPRNRQVVVVCRSGNRSQQARDILLNAGFEQVTSMAGGLNNWRASGYPIEP